MKVKFIALAVALSAAIGGIAYAQDNCPNCPKDGTPQNKMYQPQLITDFMMEGILLDIPQQAKMDSINATLKAMPRARRPMHAQRQQGCAQATCKNDSACAAAPAKRPMRGRQHGGPMMSPEMQLIPGIRYIAAVKEVLTPEQFDIFMNNIANLPCPQAAQCPDGAPAQCPNGAPAQCAKGHRGGCNNAAPAGTCDKGGCDKKGCDKGNCDKKGGCDKKGKANCDKGGCDKKGCDKGNCDKKGGCDKKGKGQKKAKK